MTRIASITIAVLAGFLATSVVVPRPAAAFPPPGGYVVVPAYPALPPPRVEVMPPPPAFRRAFVVWEPGHWRWDGYRYDWIGGRYVQRVAGASRFVPGHWAPRPGGYVWVRGHWG